MLQDGSYQFRFLIRSLDYSIGLIFPKAYLAFESTQPLTEMSTRSLPARKGWPALKANILTAICEPIVYQMWEPRSLTTVWASKTCYRDSFTCFIFLLTTP
jgi:hypothetical protein